MGDGRSFWFRALVDDGTGVSIFGAPAVSYDGSGSAVAQAEMLDDGVGAGFNSRCNAWGEGEEIAMEEQCSRELETLRRKKKGPRLDMSSPSTFFVYIEPGRPLK